MYNANGDKLVRKFLPVQLYDIHGIELWLEDMSAKGLIFDSFGVRSAIFRVGEPEHGVRYRLEPMSFWDRSVDYEKNDAYAQEGWEYVDFISRYYYIYRCRDQSVPDLHTDPVTQSLVFTRMFKRRAIPVLLLLLYDIRRIFVSGTLGAGSLQAWTNKILNSLVRVPYLTCLYLILAPWTVVVIIAYLRRTWMIWKLRCQLAQGIPLDAGKRYPRSRIRSAAFWSVPAAAMLLMLGMTLFITVPPFTYSQMLTPETELPAPFFSLYDVELEEGYELPFNNTLERSPSPFSVNHCLSQGFGWKDNIRGNLYTQEAQLELVLYDTCSPVMAQAVLDDHSTSRYQSLSFPGVDALYANTPYHEEPEQEWLYLYGRTGNRYFSVTIAGVKDPWSHIDRLLEQLARQEL